MRYRVRNLATLALAATMVATSAAHAVDATGRWVLHSTLIVPPLPGVDVTVENWVQAGSVLTTDTGYAGTISSVSGAFLLTRPNSPPCSHDARAGTVALDGNTFTATEVLTPLLSPPDICGYGAVAVTGTRCPNGTIEPDEQCDDGNAADGDGCDGTCRIEPCHTCTGAPSICTPQPAGTPCADDGLECTTDTCDPLLGCVHPLVPGACDDGHACTVDSCASGVGCVNTPDVRTCRSAQSSTLRLHTTAGETRDRLGWKWTKGQTTSAGEFADPRTTADYTFCLFAGSGAAVVGEASIPPDAARWFARNNGFRYRDRTRAKGGIGSMVLVGRDGDRSRIVMRGGGAELFTNSPPLDVPLTAQLLNRETDVCWSATYDAGDVLRNEPGELKATATSP